MENQAPAPKTVEAHVKDVDQAAFVKALAAFFKKSGKLKVPEWVDCVKTGVYKELAPYDDDWFYTRTASVARHLYIRFPAGVKSFTKIYGGRQRKGVRPSHFARGSGNIARKCLQALELLKIAEKDGTGGRRLTQVGRRDLDRIAVQIRGSNTTRPGMATAIVTTTAAPIITVAATVVPDAGAADAAAPAVV